MATTVLKGIQQKAKKVTRTKYSKRTTKEDKLDILEANLSEKEIAKKGTKPFKGTWL